MPNIRTVEISCELFQGYQIRIDLDYINNNDDIVKKIVDELRFFLKECNLINLLERMGEKKFHIHKEFGEILLSQPGEIIWVCSHCQSG